MSRLVGRVNHWCWVTRLIIGSLSRGLSNNQVAAGSSVCNNLIGTFHSDSMVLLPPLLTDPWTADAQNKRVQRDSVLAAWPDRAQRQQHAAASFRRLPDIRYWKPHPSYQRL